MPDSPNAGRTRRNSTGRNSALSNRNQSLDLKKTAAQRAPLSEYIQAAKEPAVTLRYYFLLALMRAVTLSMDFAAFLPGTFAYWPARSTPSLPTKELEPKKLTHSAQLLPALIGDDSSK